MKNLSELLQLIEVERISPLIYRGESSAIGSPNVFGGQVVAQALYAVSQTVEKDRYCHSLHSYFILPGDLSIPIIYEVEKTRDGGSFSTRRVQAKQNDKTIFIMAASFQLKQDGYSHQIQMPKVPPPTELYSWDDIYNQMKGRLPKSFEQFLSIERPIEFKPTVINNPLERKKLPTHLDVWLRFKGEAKTHEEVRKCLLAYASDYNILSAALQPHADVAHFGNTQMASLDHAMWFYHDFNPNEWLLYHIETPAASGARGFANGHFFKENGTIVASVTQEGLMRPLQS